MDEAEEQSQEVIEVDLRHVFFSIRQVIKAGAGDREGDEDLDVSLFHGNETKCAAGKGDRMPDGEGSDEHQQVFPLSSGIHDAKGYHIQDVVVAIDIQDML